MATPDLTRIPDAHAILVDTEGFDMRRYCGAYVLPGDPAALVETGASPTAERVLAAIDAADVARESVERVFVTHVHMDHAGAAWKLLESLPNARLVVHEKGTPYLTDPRKVEKLQESVARAVGKRAPLWGTLEPVDPARVDAVNGGEAFTVAGRTLRIVDAPGHAPHHYVLHDESARVVYSGDALGMRPPGAPLLMTTPPPRFDLAAWKDTLARIRTLDPRLALLTHFGPVPAREQIDAYEAALDAWVNAIRALWDAGVTEEQAVKRLMDAHPEMRDVYDEDTFEEEVRLNLRGVWLWLERGA